MLTTVNFEATIFHSMLSTVNFEATIFFPPILNDEQRIDILRDFLPCEYMLIS